MNHPLPIWIILVVSWMISIVLALQLWKAKEPLWFKVVASMALVIPVFGPLLYYFFKMPPRHPPHLRHTMNQLISFGTKPFDDDSSRSSNAQTEPVRRALTGWEKTALVVAFLVLAIYWTKAIDALISGNPWADRNYWGQPIGTFLLLGILVAGTVAFIAILWKFWLAAYFQPGAAEEYKSTAGPTTRSTRTRRKRRAG